MRELIRALVSSWHGFSEDKAARLASSIAYATIFSLAPLLIVLIAIVGFVIGTHDRAQGDVLAENALLAQISSHAGPQAATAIREMVTAQFSEPRKSVVAQVIGWAAFLVAVSGLFATLQDALNTIWNVEATKGGWRLIVRSRATSLGLVVVLGFLLVVSFGANAVLAIISTRYFAALPFVNAPLFLGILDGVLNLALMTAVFAALFKVLPDVSITWKDVIGGALVTAVLFIVGESAISLYIAKAGIASAYGAAGSVLVALVWIYYSATIVLFGAEYTKVRCRDAKTTVRSVVRGTIEVPAGVDPRITSPQEKSRQSLSSGRRA